MNPPMIPEFNMAGRLDFSPITNALGRWQAQNNQDRSFGLQERQFGENQRQFNASNALAQGHFGIAQQAADRADDMAPLQMKMLEAQIAHMRQQGASEAQMAPFKLQHLQAQTQLAQAQAKAAGTKDAFSEILMKNFNQSDVPAANNAQPPPYQPPPAAPPALQPGYAPSVRPQSFDGGNVPNALQPVADRGGDPNLILTQGASPQQPQPQASPPNMVTVPGFGTMPEARARALAMMAAAGGKGDLGKIIMDEVNRGALGKEARSEVDKKEVNTTMALGRLSEIANSYDPKHLTAKEQLKQTGLSWKGWLTGPLPPEQAAQRAEHVQFKRGVVDNLNRHIQEMTGAAMGVDEAKRLMAAMPNMQDDPDEFKAKLDDVRRSSALTIARYRLLREKGFQGQPWKGTADDAAKAIPIDKMQNIIRDQAKGVYQRIKQVSPGASHDQIMQQVKQVITAQFGIDA